MTPPTLSELFRRHGSDKDHPAGHSYGPVYEKLLAPRRDGVFSVLEVGVLGGASLRAWRDYFPSAFVIGVDVSAPTFEEWQVSARRADATKAEDLAAALGDRRFDLIVDDGSHWEHHQLATFELLKPRLKPGGLYVVEDVQCVPTHDKLRALGFEVFDLRAEKSRFDDVLAVYRHPE